MVLSAPSFQESETTPVLIGKHSGIIVAKATAPKLPAIPHKTGIQQHVHSHTLRGGCYGSVMKRCGRLLENPFFFVNDHKGLLPPNKLYTASSH